jgi:hypothetical protein
MTGEYRMSTVERIFALSQCGYRTTQVSPGVVLAAVREAMTATGLAPARGLVGGEEDPAVRAVEARPAPQRAPEGRQGGPDGETEGGPNGRSRWELR